MDETQVPNWITPQMKDDAYDPSYENILDLEPQAREEAFLKFIALRILKNLTIKFNGAQIGEYNGRTAVTVDINLGTLTIQKNGTALQTYNGNENCTANIQVPVITYGTDPPSGGNPGDVYMRYS